MRPTRLTAAADVSALSFPGITAAAVDTARRTLTGDIARYATCREVACSCCTYGRTSAGRLKIAAGALALPGDPTRVKLTREHDRAASRGHLALMVETGGTVRAAMRVSDGPEGDAALQEALDHTRDGFSVDIIDAVIEGDTIVGGTLIAVGQVGIPAYDDMRIDSVAASATTGPQAGTPHHTERHHMNEQQRARLAALRAQATRTAAEETEMAGLVAMESAEAGTSTTATTEPAPAATTAPAAPAAPAPTAVAASVPVVPGGVPTRAATTTAERDPLTSFIRTIVDGYRADDPRSITAALADVTHSGHSDNVSAPGWSGELWGGLAYEQEFAPLLNSGDLTSYEGKGWRWVIKPEIKDYAGDKTAIPSDPITTEPGSYEAARMAVGHNIDRKFYDFPDEAFLRSYVEACRESWAVKIDGKAEAHIASSAVAATIGGVAVPAQTSIFRAVSKIARALRKARAGRASFVVLSDNDFDTLLDLTNDDLPAFLKLFGIEPENFKVSSLVADGTVVGGVKAARTLRTLPGSPIRATAQHLANGGIDEAFFGYWAIETHHETGIVKVDWAEPVAP